jgi:polysaccharide export outer membrane protein
VKIIKKQFYFIIVFVASIVLLLNQSCRAVYPNVMFKNIDSTQLASTLSRLEEDYKIKIGDELFIKIFTGKGAQLIEPRTPDLNTSAGGGANMQFNNLTFMVENDGYAELPMLGKRKVEGLSENDLKDILTKEYEKYYQNPYLFIRVENRRAFVFKGSLGQIINLNRTPTNIFEVLAKSGGFDRNYKAHNIKIIRGNLRNPEIFNLDLSTMKGISNAELMVQSNDIIYLEERRRPVYYALSEASTIISLPLAIISSTLSTIFLITVLNK